MSEGADRYSPRAEFSKPLHTHIVTVIEGEGGERGAVISYYERFPEDENIILGYEVLLGPIENTVVNNLLMTLNSNHEEVAPDSPFSIMNRAMNSFGVIPNAYRSTQIEGNIVYKSLIRYNSSRLKIFFDYLNGRTQIAAFHPDVQPKDKDDDEYLHYYTCSVYEDDTLADARTGLNPFSPTDAPEALSYPYDPAMTIEFSLERALRIAKSKGYVHEVTNSIEINGSQVPISTWEYDTTDSSSLRAELLNRSLVSIFKRDVLPIHLFPELEKLVNFYQDYRSDHFTDSFFYLDIPDDLLVLAFIAITFYEQLQRQEQRVIQASLPFTQIIISSKEKGSDLTIYSKLLESMHGSISRFSMSGITQEIGRIKYPNTSVETLHPQVVFSSQIPGVDHERRVIISMTSSSMNVRIEETYTQGGVTGNASIEQETMKVIHYSFPHTVNSSAYASIDPQGWTSEVIKQVALVDARQMKEEAPSN